jgi:hypothetical protein
MSASPPHLPWQRVASILWFPVFFAVALPLTFEVVYHQPRPRHVSIAVVGGTSRVRLVANELNHISPGGFEVRRLASPAAASDAVRDRKVAAAYAGGSAPTVYLAQAAAPLRANYLEQVFGKIAAASGREPPHVVDLVPLASGDSGLGVFFFVFPLMMAGLITAIVLLQLPAWGIGRRVLVVGAVGAIGALAAYLTVGGLHVLPADPLLLAYAFLLTQVYGQLMASVASFLKQYFLPVSLTAALIISVPSSGGTVSPDMMPGLFHGLSYVLPLGQGVTITRGVAYFHNAGIAQATLVLGLWAALAAGAVAFAWVRQARPRSTGPRSSLTPGETSSAPIPTHARPQEAV